MIMKDTVVFDIETQKSFEEVGGRENLHLLGISVVAAYSYNHDKTFVFEEKNLNQFQKLLDETDTLIGFNSASFDVPILEVYSFKVDSFNKLDLMEDVVKSAGFRVSLDNIAGTTLGVRKSADGLQAIRWYKEGNMEDIKKYCVKDVLITKDVYEYGKNNGHVLFLNRQKAKVAIPVFWGKAEIGVREVLEKAFEERKTVEIDYVTHSPDFKKSDSAKNKRLVDIFSINKHIVEGYCHLRQAKRVFKIERILDAKITDNGYKMENDVQNAFI